MNRNALLGALLLLAFHPPQTVSFPFGAGGCAGGVPAVAGFHLPANIEGALADFDLQVRIDGIPLNTSRTTNFTVGNDHIVELSGGSFKGFLLRLAGGNDSIDTTESLSATSDLSQVAESVCVDMMGVGGITHTSNVLKSSIQGTLRLDEVGTNLPLDVTVVAKNNFSGSEFYYSRYFLNSVDLTTTPPEPTTMPSNRPTSKPTAAPTGNLSIPPTTEGPTTTSIAPTLQPTPTDPSIRSKIPSQEPSILASNVQTEELTSFSPTEVSSSPSSTLTASPTSSFPTASVIQVTSDDPSRSPTSSPTLQPTSIPSSMSPTNKFSSEPSSKIVTDTPSDQPTFTIAPSSSPPSPEPTADTMVESPSMDPSNVPTGTVSVEPTFQFSEEPTTAESSSRVPSDLPSQVPTNELTDIPSSTPSTQVPTGTPTTMLPTNQPTKSRSAAPSDASSFPSTSPSDFILSEIPTDMPVTTIPSMVPSVSPTGKTTESPTTIIMSHKPSQMPSLDVNNILQSLSTAPSSVSSGPVSQEASVQPSSSQSEGETILPTSSATTPSFLIILPPNLSFFIPTSMFICAVWWDLIS